MKYARITVNPRQMAEVACIRNLRISGATVVGMIADGMTIAKIVEAYPDLEPEDIQESLRYADSLTTDSAIWVETIEESEEAIAWKQQLEIAEINLVT